MTPGARPIVLKALRAQSVQVIAREGRDGVGDFAQGFFPLGRRHDDFLETAFVLGIPVRLFGLVDGSRGRIRRTICLSHAKSVQGRRACCSSALLLLIRSFLAWILLAVGSRSRGSRI